MRGSYKNKTFSFIICIANCLPYLKNVRFLPAFPALFSACDQFY